MLRSELDRAPSLFVAVGIETHRPSCQGQVAREPVACAFALLLRGGRGDRAPSTSDTQPVDGIASCHRAANCAESDRADRSAVPAAAARADCTTARVWLRPRRLVLASTASEAFAGAERDPDRGEGLL